MILVEKNKQQLLEFNLNIEGAKVVELTPYLRINVNGIEYGFKGSLTESKVSFTLPPLSSVVPSITTGTYDARLDVMSTEGLYLTPWKEELSIEEHLKIEAQLSSSTPIEKSGTKPSIKVTATASAAVAENKAPVKVPAKEGATLGSLRDALK